MLYRRLLKAQFDLLPRVLRDFHAMPGGGRASGEVTVRHDHPALARMLGFPAAGDRLPAQLTVEASSDREIWIRRFGGSVLRSEQRQAGDLLVETAGPLRISFRIEADRTGMRFETRRVLLFGLLPLPIGIKAEARGGESSWQFNVIVPWIGSYQGEMAPEP